MPPPKDPEKYKEYCEKLSRIGKEVRSTPEYKERFAKLMQEKAKDPEFRRKQRESHLGVTIDKIVDPAHKENKINGYKKRSENKAWREQLTERNRIMSLDPVRRENHSKIMNGKVVGDKNPLWKGGITPLNHMIRTSSRYLEWRDAVFARDDYRDWFTGLRSHDLHAHHIVPFNILIERYGIETYEQAMNCEHLWNVSNGASMDGVNHIAYHEMWGYVYDLCFDWV